MHLTVCLKTKFSQSRRANPREEDQEPVACAPKVDVQAINRRRPSQGNDVEAERQTELQSGGDQTNDKGKLSTPALD